MHIFIENARKAAGISGLKRNYPDDKHHRGAGHWAAFLGSLSTDLAKQDAFIQELMKENAVLRKRASEEGVKVACLEENLTEGQVKKIAGKVA